MVIPDEVLDLLVPADYAIPKKYGDLVSLREVLAHLTEDEPILHADFKVSPDYLESFRCYTKSYVITLLVTGHESFFTRQKRNP